MFLNKHLVVIPGIILAFVLYTLSQGFNNIIGIELLGYSKSPISTAMIAILIGMFFGKIAYLLCHAVHHGEIFVSQANICQDSTVVHLPRICDAVGGKYRIRDIHRSPIKCA